MKKLKLAIIAILLSTVYTNTHAQTFTKGTTLINAGLGVGWYNYDYNVSSFPAISLSMEKGVYEVPNIGIISAGAIFEWKNAYYNYPSFYLTQSYTEKWNWNDYVFGARAALHLSSINVDKLDVYGGLALGVRIETSHFQDNSLNIESSTSSTVPLFAFYAGARYNLTEKVAAFGELGYGLGYLTLGVSYKLK